MCVKVFMQHYNLTTFVCWCDQNIIPSLQLIQWHPFFSCQIRITLFGHKIYLRYLVSTFLDIFIQSCDFTSLRCTIRFGWKMLALHQLEGHCYFQIFPHFLHYVLLRKRLWVEDSWRKKPSCLDWIASAMPAIISVLLLIIADDELIS